MNTATSFIKWAKSHQSTPVNFKYYLRARQEYGFSGTPVEFYQLLSGKSDDKGTVGDYLKKIVYPSLKKAKATPKHDEVRNAVDILQKAGIDINALTAVAKLINNK